MRTSGGSSERAMMLVPLGVGIAVGMLYYGGPAALFAALDDLVGDIVQVTLHALQAWL